MNTINNEQEYLVQKIRTQYTEKQHTELDELRALDRKVKMSANAFAYSKSNICYSSIFIFCFSFPCTK